jgi:molybdate/tungstate transport system substrate-binding protein
VKRKALYILIAAAVVVAIVLPITHPWRHEKTPLKVLCAGSLMVPFTEMAEEFEKIHPNVDVLIEGHGSIQVIRDATEVAELTGEPGADVVAVADYSLIPMLMYEREVPGTSEKYADWYLKFATNNLVIAYNPQYAEYADEINSTNWYQILSRDGVKFGISDPRMDSCGYRALIVCQLAELYYGEPAIFEDLIKNNFETPITVSKSGIIYTISVPEVLEPKETITVRGSSVQLLALLDSGDIDYAFGYQSMAEQHGLSFVPLPPEINLGSQEPEYVNWYEQVKVKLDFQRFQTVKPEFNGEPIVYGITIPENAPHRDLAIEFVKFVIGPQGQEVLDDMHHPSIVPAEADNLSNVPDELKPLVTSSGEIIEETQHANSLDSVCLITSQPFDELELRKGVRV